jgi:hypothetical protein
MFASRFSDALLLAATPAVDRRRPISVVPNRHGVIALSRNDAGFSLILSETSRKMGTFAGSCRLAARKLLKFLEGLSVSGSALPLSAALFGRMRAPPGFGAHQASPF